MSSRKTKLVAVAASALAAAGIAGGALASSASASTANYGPKPVPHACAYNLNGGNVLDLTFQGNTYTYPVVLHVANDGLITGILLDKGLPVGQQYLRVHGVCAGSDVDLGVNYPTVDPQGQRVEDMNITKDPTLHHFGDAAGVWDETGTEAGSGAASFQFPVHRS